MAYCKDKAAAKDFASTLSESSQLLSELSSQSKDLALQLQEVTSKLKSYQDCVLSEDTLLSLKKRIHQIKADLALSADLVPRLITPIKIPWVPENREDLRLQFVRGDPWEFYMTFDDDQELEFITDTLRKTHSEGRLEKCCPEVGKYVVCHQKPDMVFFRALITYYNPQLFTLKAVKSVHVYQLDSGHVTAVTPDDVYRLPPNVSTIPCRMVKCCMVVEEKQLKHTFSVELQSALKRTLQAAKLSVTLMDMEPESNPPCFLAKVTGTSMMDINRWITNVVIPRLRNVLPGCSNVAAFVEDHRMWDPFNPSSSDSDKVNFRADEKQTNKAEPAQVTLQNLVNECAVPQANQIQSDTLPSTTGSFPDEPCDPTIAASVRKVTNWIDGGSPVCKVELPRPTPIVEPFFDVDLIKNQRAPKTLTPTEIPPVVRASKEHPSPSKPARTSKHSRPEWNTTESNGLHDNSRTEIGNHSEPKHSKVVESSSLATSAPEFVPHCLVSIIHNNNDEDDYDGIVANLEEEYQPNDEKRICLFYQKHGYCRFKVCRKEHIKKSALWTTDTIGIYDAPFNEVDLPSEGREVLLTIQHIKSPVSFYVNLEPEYSDIGEPVVETIHTLYNDLNSVESNNTHQLLPVDPELSEIVIALGQQDFLGPRKRWLRAQVRRWLDGKSVEVFFLDFGNTAVVKLTDLRQIRPQFLHLPAQAVLTYLAGVKSIPEKKEEALTFLRNSIQGKTLNAVIVSSDFTGPELEVHLLAKTGENIGDILVDENLVSVCLRHQYLL